jgi:hypothetical protein
MANIIVLIKGKRQRSAPSLAQLNVREMCFVIPDNAFLYKRMPEPSFRPVDTGSGR